MFENKLFDTKVKKMKQQKASSERCGRLFATLIRHQPSPCITQIKFQFTFVSLNNATSPSFGLMSLMTSAKTFKDNLDPFHTLVISVETIIQYTQLQNVWKYYI